MAYYLVSLALLSLLSAPGRSFNLPSLEVGQAAASTTPHPDDPDLKSDSDLVGSVHAAPNVGQSFNFGGNVEHPSETSTDSQPAINSGPNFDFGPNGLPSSNLDVDSEPPNNGQNFDFGLNPNKDTDTGEIAVDGNDGFNLPDLDNLGPGDLDNLGPGDLDNLGPDDLDNLGPGDLDLGTSPVGSAPGGSPENKKFNFSSNQGSPGDDWAGATPVEQQEFPTDHLPDLPDLDIKPESSEEVKVQGELTETSGEQEGLQVPAATGRPRVGRVVSEEVAQMSCPADFEALCDHGTCHVADDDDTGLALTCACDDGWTGDFCTKPCELSCQHGDCRVNSANQQVCNCDFNWTGDLCHERKPDPAEQTRILAIVLSSCIALVLAIAVLLPLLLWKKRVIFVMKMVYFFQQYEDDDGKQFDAYVSLSPNVDAESFVYSALRPKLEGLGFKLCLQARNLTAGTVLSDGIIEAIEQSRRTILVVTPDYVRHEWAKFEYLIAQHEMLKLKQKIIPIIVGDLDKETMAGDKSLKHLLNSVKCLRCPASLTPQSPSDLSPRSAQSPDPLVSSAGMFKSHQQQDKKEQKFWKRLQLTMPKLKASSECEASLDTPSPSLKAPPPVLTAPSENIFQDSSEKVYHIPNNFQYGLSGKSEKCFPVGTCDKLHNFFNSSIDCDHRKDGLDFEKSLLDVCLSDETIGSGKVKKSRNNDLNHGGICDEQETSVSSV